MSIVVCGAGVVGLGAAMMLAADGHRVTVLEADPEPVPAGAADAVWDGWTRKGVTQFQQPNVLLARFRHVCEAELPAMTDALAAAGCRAIYFLRDFPPPTLTDTSARPGDERFGVLTGRRPVVEAVFARAAAETPGVEVRRGAKVTGLLGDPRPDGVPHVTGVRLADGGEIRADLVVDATGRRSAGPDWLAQLGARAPEAESSHCGFVYYSRFLTGPVMPRPMGPFLIPIGTISILTLPADNDVWSVTVFCATGDAPLKAIRDPEVFARVVAACPLQAHWLEGTPVTDVLPMAGVLDQYRRYVVGGEPVATGYAAVGDAWACTNPSLGRGLSLGLWHAALLRRVLRAHADDPRALAVAFDAAAEEQVAPYYRATLAADRARLAEMDALRKGLEPPPPGPEARVRAAAAYDPDVFRGVLDIANALATPAEVVARPAVREALERFDGRPRPFPGPDRARLLDLVGS